MIMAGLIDGTGYTGVELLRLLALPAVAAVIDIYIPIIHAYIP